MSVVLLDLAPILLRSLEGPPETIPIAGAAIRSANFEALAISDYRKRQQSGALSDILVRRLHIALGRQEMMRRRRATVGCLTCGAVVIEVFRCHQAAWL